MKPAGRADVLRCSPQGRKCRHLLCGLAVVALALALVSPANVQGQRSKPTEYEVKATYLYNFTRFVDWPAKSTQAQSDSFSICVLGQDPFGPVLNAIIADETVAGKRVVAKRVPTPQDALNCHVLFISSSEKARLKQILTTLGDASVLTVSDLPEFTQRGGMVQFILEGSKVRFEVNLAAAEHAGLTLSSELLKVAVNVRRISRLGN
jgi:hypothetical protein